MKKYNASYTVEATFVMIIIIFALVGILSVVFFMADCQTTRNMLIINSIKKSEEYYFYAGDDTRRLKVENKVTAGIYGHSFNTSTLDFERLCKDKMFGSKLETDEQSLELTGIYTKASIKSGNYTSHSKEGVSRRNNSDFIRIVSILANNIT